MNVESGVQIDLLGAVKRRGFLACSVAGVVTLVMYWIAMGMTNEYTSSAVLLVEPQAVNDKLVEAGAGSIDLNERLNLMTSEILSRTRLSKIIDELGIFEEESENMTRDEVVDLMRSQISVRPVLPELTRAMQLTEIEINTFEIFFSSDSAAIAAEVAQRLANDFIQEHIANRVRSTQTSLEFISHEQDRLSTSIEEVTAEIAEIKENHEGSLPDALPVNQRILERTLSEIRTTRRVLDQAESDVKFWEHQVQTADQMAAAGENGDRNSPTARLQMLELHLAEMKARGFTERHPDMIQVRGEITELKVAIERGRAAGAAGEDGGDVPVSFAQQSAMAEKLRAENSVTAAEAEIQRNEDLLEEIEADIAATPRVAEMLDGLLRTHLQLTSSLDGFSQLRLSASVQADLERRQLGERFRILESAIAPREVSSPNRALIIAIGLVLGLGLGVAAGVIAEGTDPSYHVSRELQAAVGIPVIAVIPSILLDPDLAAQRRKLRWRIFLATALTGFCLVGGVVTYIWVNGAPSWMGEILSGQEAEESAMNQERMNGWT